MSLVIVTPETVA
ncbi:hypothetical protein LDE55_08105, partial [Mycobacterium tuberculosis]